MPNTHFQFRQFRIEQAQSGMKVTSDGCLFGGWVASEIRKYGEPKRILDIGAGTGLLSLMLAQVTEDAEITAVEINESAFNEARHNFEQSPWSDRMQCLHTPIQELKGEKYDLIICNPPFFKDSQQGVNTDKNQAVHSNDLHVEDLLNQVLRLLDKDGSFYLLYPEREMKEFTKASKGKGLFPNQKVIVRNQKDQPVFRVMARFRFEEMKAITSELIIRNANRKYTPESCWELLKGYYLEYNDPSL
ncbi:tRNA1(Val) (adenine(37)-N6)-methyltransferase [Ekhidna sp.]|uniref:tRNA1(Val) (adenine(37)-N6)-methyltransferase n=1 Tax=Ekhidna sp. TaxID=2608089 RepID=UPI003B5BC820